MLNGQGVVRLSQIRLIKERRGSSTELIPKIVSSVVYVGSSALMLVLEKRRKCSNVYCGFRNHLFNGSTVKHSNGRSRVLVFNCTHDRNGASLLSLVLSEAVDQFKLHRGVNVELKDVFDHVIFTSNITYTGGTFKSGMYSPDVHDKLTNSC